MEENSLENVIGYEALYESMLKCKKGVMWKDSTASFRMNAIERCMRLSEELKTGKYKPSPPVYFQVTSPKRRDIASVSFRDRVYQRSLNDNEVYPVMTKSFIYDNFACQTGKGTDAARNRLKQFLHEYYRKYGQIGYVAQFDIRGYYPNMDHSMTESTFRKHLRPEIYELVLDVLNNQYQGDKGYDAGSQLIQIAGISVLDGFDHFVKEQLHAHFYLRYMDDFLIISNDREYLTHCIEEVSKKMDELIFELHPDKTRIFPIKEGIEFLGFTFRLTETGKVLMLIKSDNVKRERKKLVRLVNRSKRGLIPREKVDESYKAWRDHAEKGNSFKLLQRMDAFYKDLWKEKKHDSS